MVDWVVVILHSRDVWHLGSTTGSNSTNNTTKTAEGHIVDDPSTQLVLEDPINLDVEASSLFEAVALPELPDLTEDLLLVRVSTIPLD